MTKTPNTTPQPNYPAQIIGDKPQPGAEHAVINAAALRGMDDAGAQPAPITFMTEDHACKWAWDQVRKDVGTEGWTTGDSCNFYGFFLWGWNYRGQYEVQRTAVPPAPAGVAVPDADAAARFKAQHDFLKWNRAQQDPLVKVAREYGVFNKAVDLYRAALAAGPAQAVPSGMWTIWESLPGYLIDHCEGEIISEEGLQRALEAMLKDPQYSMPPAAPAQEHATQLAEQGQEDCAVLDGDWRRRMLDGSAIARDEMGCGEHPALPVLEEGMKPKQFFDALGIELEGVMAEDQMDMDAYDAMVEATDYNVWMPEAPAGDGWVLVAIFDTEDGPAAWWMRESAPEQPARKNRKAAPAQAQEDARDAARYQYWKQWWVHEESETAQLPKTVDQMLEELDIDSAFDAAIAAARAAQGEAA